MVVCVKFYKVGFVVSDLNIKFDNILKDIFDLKEKIGYFIVVVIEDGILIGKLLGIVVSCDYCISCMDLDIKVSEFMIFMLFIVYVNKDVILKEVNNIIWDYKFNFFFVFDDNGNFMYMVFCKDYFFYKENLFEFLDFFKRYVVGVGINIRDFVECVFVLVEVGVDVLCIDFLEGFFEW